MGANEQRDNEKRQGVNLKDARIQGLNKDIKEIKEMQMSIEDKIYMVSL